MPRYRNTPLHHAVRYPLFEYVSGALHEQHLRQRGNFDNWLDSEARQALSSLEGRQVEERHEYLTPMVADIQQVTSTRPKYIAQDPVVPTGAYKVETIKHHFSYDGQPLPRPADTEVLLCHGGICVGPGGEPVAAVKFDPRLLASHDGRQQAVIYDETAGQWVGPESPEQMALTKGYIDLMVDLGQKAVEGRYY